MRRVFMFLTAALSAPLILLATSGCLSTETSSKLGDTLDSTAVSMIGARAFNTRMAYREGLTVEKAADSIIALAPDSAVRMNAYIWKMYCVPVIRSVYTQTDPFASLMDATAFAKQCEEYLSTGLGRDRFGPYQPIALRAVRANARRLESTAATILTTARRDTFMARTDAWVGEHPLDNHFFNRASILLTLGEFLADQDNSIGSTVGRMADDIDDLSSRISLLSAQLPREARWQAEYLMNDLALKDRLATIDRTITVLNRTLANVDRLLASGNLVVDIKSLQSLHGDLLAALERVSAEREIVLADVDRQRVATLEAVESRVGKTIDTAFDRIDATVDRVLWRIAIALLVLLAGAVVALVLVRRGLLGRRNT